MKIYLLVTFLLSAITIDAQSSFIKSLDGSSISSKSIDSTIEHLMTAGKVEGLSLAIINNNEIAYKKAYGFADKEKQTLLDTSSVLYAASFSKAVFAYINMQLWQKGLIDLDKPLSQYLKKPLSAYGRYADLEKDERWKTITPRMCLSHTTGLPNIWSLNVHSGEIDTNLTNKLYFKPGTRYAYSGEGLKLLQKVEEELLGKDLEQIAQEEVFIPAGMTRSSYVWQTTFEANSASGHDEQGKPAGKLRSGKPSAAGSMLTTISDYARFITYVLKSRGLQPKYYKEMIRPQIRINSSFQFPTITDEITHRDDTINLSYGLGWGSIKTPFGVGFFKEGHHDYWRNYNINFPDKKTAIIIMTNSANGEGIFKELLDRLIGDKYTPWEWERYVPYNTEIK